MSSHQLTYVTIIAGYLIGILGIALWVGKKWVGDESDFMIAGREMGSTLTAASLVAILLSGGFVPTIVLFGFIAGLGGAWFFWAWALGQALVLVTWAGFWRQTGAYTPAEYFEYQHGLSGRLAVLTSILLFGLIAGSFQYLGAGSIIAGALDIGLATAIVVVGIVITAYAMLAGIWGVSITDFIQSVWVIGSVFVILPIYLYLNYDTPSAGVESISPEMMSLPFGGMEVVSFAGGTVLTFIMLQFLLANAAHYWTRASAARNKKTVQRGWTIAIAVTMVLGLIGAYLGLWARMLVPDAPPGQAFGILLAERTPVWLGALAISGIIAATMSTADMMYQIIANTVTRDFFQRFRNVTDRKTLLRVSRGVVLASGVVTISLAVLLIDLGLAGLISFALAMGGPLMVLSFDAWTFQYGTKEGTVLTVAAVAISVFYWVIVAPPFSQGIDQIWVSLVVSVTVYYTVSAIAHATGSWWTEPERLTDIDKQSMGDD
jgi:SSS family solute:Na+ symporter